MDIANSTNLVTGGNGSPQDNVGHGTYVAGLLAAKYNDQGIVGVAAGATVVAVKVLAANGTGSFSDIAAGINYVDHNASQNDIINLSLGGPISEMVDNAVIAGANHRTSLCHFCGKLESECRKCFTGTFGLCQCMD